MVEKYTGKGKKAEHEAEYRGKEPSIYHGKEPPVKPGSKPAELEYHGKEPPRKKK